MSNALLYDPPLVHALAGELDIALRGRPCAAAPIFLRDGVAVLPLDRGEALRFDLHPRRGWIHLVPWDTESDELDGICVGVEAPADERRLLVRVRTGDRFRAGERTLVVELQTNQWNVLLVNETDGRILSALRPRSAGKRLLRPGQPYEPPPPQDRYGAREVPREEAWNRWVAILGDTPPELRRGRLLDSFALLGSVNVDAILGRAASDAGAEPLLAAFGRWWELRSRGSAPVLLHPGSRRIPYPRELRGIRSEPIPSLLAGMALLAEEGDGAPAEETESEHLRERISRRYAAAARRVERLEEQLAGVGEAARLRERGDLLLANLHRVERGAASVRLLDWNGEPVEIELEPTLTPAENAARWYDAARRRARAEARLPELIEAAREERERWATALAAVADGAAPEWALSALERREPTVEKAGVEERRPYTVFRTDGGLEVRVGRSARDNDRLTFGHSSPQDVWLHARSVPGSHVILRWPDPNGGPPARDLEQAAVLAALYSRARSSALVPVDWTRRKHVRKPRGAAPGAVIPQRVKSLLVEPDPAVEERMRIDP